MKLAFCPLFLLLFSNLGGLFRLQYYNNAQLHITLFRLALVWLWRFQDDATMKSAIERQE